jgi:hydrogenase assembly chaperone HypC/HupF
MCLGIPGQVVRVLEGNAGMLALVDVVGAQRPINLGMLEDPAVEPGQWVLIHMGFALEVIDETKAREARAGLEMMGNALEGPPDTGTHRA